MSSGKTHYEVMGLAPTATPEEVKKRYRELARQNHPDLNRHRPEAHELFLRIKEAYEVLNDPTRRASYDLSLRDMARRQGEQRAGSFGSAPTGPRPGGAARPPGGGPRPADPRTARDQEQRRQRVGELMGQARQAYNKGNLRDAQQFCQEVLEIARYGPAYELLGDICRQQNRMEAAIHNYTLAAQLQPYNGLIMAKLNRLIDRHNQAGGATARQDPAARGATIGTTAQMGHKLMVTCFGLAVILLILFVAAWRGDSGSPEERLDWQLVPNWTRTHLILMAVTGFLSGALLAAATWIRPFEQELLFPAGGGRRPMPLVFLLMVFGATFMHLAFLFYVVTGIAREAVSASVLAVFGVAYLLVIGFGIALPGAFMETLLFGGNCLFVTMLIGWFVGDLFRPHWAM